MNKYTNTIITIVAALILIGVGVHVWNEKKEHNHDHNHDKEPMHVEVVQTEEGEQEIELDRPLSQSFSNAVSNTQSAEAKKTAHANTVSTTSNFVSKAVETITRPFTLGFYYFDTINKHGIEKCTAQHSGEDENDDIPDYDEDNFKLTDISFKDNSVYLHVDADESPKKTCAQIVQFKNLKNTIYDAIHVVVE